MAQWIWRFPALLCALVATGFASAQDTRKGFQVTPAEKIPIPREGKPDRILKLTLADAMVLAARQNIDLSARELVPQGAIEDLRIAKAFFESELFAEAGIRSTRSPGRTTFDPPLSRDLYDGRAGWRKRLITGGSLDVSFDLADQEQQAQSAANFPPRLYSTGWNVEYTQPLLRGAWTDYALRDVNTAEANLAGARATYEQDRQNLLLDVSRAYWELVFARGEYRVQYQALQLAQEQLRITNEKIRVRALAPRDRIADEAEIAARKEELIRARAEIHDRADDLRRLLFNDQDGVMWRVGIEPTSPIESNQDVDKVRFEPLRRVARRNRPDLQTFRNRVRVAEIELMASTRDLLPQLDVVGTYAAVGTNKHSNEAWGDAFDVEFPNWSVRLQFSIPIGNSAAKARRRRAMLFYEEERRTLFARELTIDLELRDAIRGLRTFKESVVASKESVRLAESNLDTAQAKWRVGELTFFDVQDRNLELQQARSRLLRNQASFRVAQTVLLHAQGKLEVPKPRKDPQKTPKSGDKPKQPKK